MGPDGFTNREEHVEMLNARRHGRIYLSWTPSFKPWVVDSEHGQIAGLRAQMLSGVLSPEEAITRARAILETRSDTTSRHSPL